MGRDPVSAARERVDALMAAWEESPRLLDATVALGFPREVAARGLAAEMAAWRDPEMFQGVVASVCDHAKPTHLPRRVLIIAARTLPASAMRQMLAARALGADVRLKPASGQADLGAALCADGRFGDTIAMITPDAPDNAGGRDDARLAAEMLAADTIVVLGSDATVATLEARTPPGRTFVGFGHRISAAIVGTDPKPSDLQALADDVMAWDRSGCLSPQRIWADGVDPVEVARALAEPLADATRSLPLGPTQAMARRVALTRARMSGATVIECGRFALVVGMTPEMLDAATVVPVESFSEQTFETLVPLLSTVGVPAADIDRWRLRVPPSVRVAPLGTMQTPPLTWAQDGHPPLACLLRPG